MCVYVNMTGLIKKKKTKWPVARQDFQGRKNAGKKDRVLRSWEQEAEEAGNKHAILRQGAEPCGRTQIEMWLV